MVMIFGLVAAGFVAGVLLTTLIACQYFGCLHAEAVTILDSGCYCRRTQETVKIVTLPFEQKI